MYIHVCPWIYVTRRRTMNAENLSSIALALDIAISRDDKTEGKKCSYNKYHNNSRFF
jgi:hypothetical protein